MKRFGHGPRLATAAIVLSFAVAGRAQDEGVKKVELLAKKAGSTVEAIANTKVQLMKTMDVYNGLMADGATDRREREPEGRPRPPRRGQVSRQRDS